MLKETKVSLVRQPGAPLPPDLVRSLREKSGLTQEQLARKMGVGGGKAVISGWETGRTSCEGPAAELLLLLLGGADVGVATASLLDEMERLWYRAGNYVPVWRQVSAVLHSELQIDRATFATLFPRIALKDDEQAHGFPPVFGLGDPFGITRSEWVGSIPSNADKAPTYLWMLKRDGRFAYRERVWENDNLSPMRGHVDIHSVLAMCLAMVFFYRKVADECGLDHTIGCTLRIDLGGMQGRGLVRPMVIEDGILVPVDDREVPSKCAEDRIFASVTTTIQKLRTDPVGAGLEVVGELALLLNPTMAREEQLRTTLQAAYERDRKARFRALGFLDGEKL